jgi:ferric-dicitrate binding protein FerR (iron transport regulator)
VSELPRDDRDYLEIAHGHVPDEPGAERAARLLALAESLQAPVDVLDVDRAWAELDARLDARRALKWLDGIVGVAAVLVFGVATYLTVSPIARAHADELYVAPATGSLTVRLPDGSRATLAPLARVRYRASYFRPVRTVTLEGEAGFFVAADSAHPVDVVARDDTVAAVGSVFTVRANTWEGDVTVAVERGAVRVGGAEIVREGEKITVR